jgi:site-specific DNA-methyltransferase (adenine-specific)
MPDYKNQLYFGDCLDVLKNLYDQHPDGFIDLIYIDPPFNSKRNYNILFEDIKFADAQAQKQAFADTWSNVSYKDTKEQIKDLDLDLFHLLDSFDKIRISKSAVAYLTTMAIRIWYMHKVLKETGSFYLHCDPTMSHYLKIVCDMVFGINNFLNELIWCYKERGISKTYYNRKHDVILFYAKKRNYHAFNWHEIKEAYSEVTLKKFKYVDEYGRKFRIRGRNVPEAGKWRRKTDIPIEFESEFTYRQYLIEPEGSLPKDWFEIPFLNQAAKERLGYPTQKPERLLEKIIKASSNKNDLVADFFCGCGTTVAVAERLGRKWMGVDISHLSIGLIEKRIIHSYGKQIKETYEINGFPKDIASAKELAHSQGGRLKFQDWIIESKLGGVHNPRKTADGGWDGHATFQMDKKKEVVLIEVKSGQVNVKNLREFIHVVTVQQASIGVFVCFAEYVTKPMQLEAKNQGYFHQEFFGQRYRKIQILTVEEILDEKEIQKPQTTRETFKQAQRDIKKSANQNNLF